MQQKPIRAPDRRSYKIIVNGVRITRPKKNEQSHWKGYGSG